MKIVNLVYIQDFYAIAVYFFKSMYSINTFCMLFSIKLYIKTATKHYVLWS